MLLQSLPQPRSGYEKTFDQPSSDCMGCIFRLLQAEQETRKVITLTPWDRNAFSSLFVIVTGVPQKTQGLIIDKVVSLHDLACWHSSDRLIARKAQFIVCYSDPSIAFHAQNHLQETPPFEYAIESPMVRCHARSASSILNSWESMWCPMNCSLCARGTLHNLQRTIESDMISLLCYNHAYYPNVDKN